MPNPSPLLFSCAGLGGFAGSVCDRLLAASLQPEAPIKLVAACDPQPHLQPQRVAQLQAAGVIVDDNFNALLAGPAEAVWLPLPIDLHCSFTERALASGKHVLCEKPAAGAVQDVDEMIAARNRSGLHVGVGFQDVYQPGQIALQQRLASGEFGPARSATLYACWPRGQNYFRRNPWAGKLERNGVWVVDSPASNALAHFLHLALFLLGSAPGMSAVPVALSAELYRANAIETFDTCCLRIVLQGGCELLVALTHACDQTVDPEIEIHTDDCKLRVLPGKYATIWKDSGEERVDLQSDRYANILDIFCRRARGDLTAPAGATLEMARSHVLVCNGATQAAHVHEVPAGEIDLATVAKDGSPLNAIRDLPAMLAFCIAQKKMLHETNLAPWSNAAADIDLRNYDFFQGPRAF